MNDYDWADAIKRAAATAATSVCDSGWIGEMAYTVPGGGTYTVFGNAAVCVRVAGEFAPLHEFGAERTATTRHRRTSPKAAHGVFEKYILNGAGDPLDIAVLKAAVGQPVPKPADVKIDCPSCNGTGGDRCPHCGNPCECEDCDGTGKVEKAVDIPRRYIRFRGEVYDAVPLSLVFPFVPDETVLAGRSAGSVPSYPNMRPLVLAGAGWSLVAMPMTFTDPIPNSEITDVS